MDNFNDRDHLAVAAVAAAAPAVVSGAKKLWYKIKKPVPKKKTVTVEPVAVTEQPSMIGSGSGLGIQSGFAAKAADIIKSKVKEAKEGTGATAQAVSVMKSLPFIIGGAVIIYFIFSYIRKR